MSFILLGRTQGKSKISSQNVAAPVVMQEVLDFIAGLEDGSLDELLELNIVYEVQNYRGHSDNYLSGQFSKLI